MPSAATSTPSILTQTSPRLRTTALKLACFSQSIPNCLKSSGKRGPGSDYGVDTCTSGVRSEAIECLREAVWVTRDHYEVGIAAGVSLRHEHGSQFISLAF